MRKFILALLLAFLVFTPAVEAQRRTSRYCYSCPRDSRGHIKRSAAVVAKFKRDTGYPHGRSGYQVDHIVPLSRGGCDCASNLQWLSKGAHAAKTRRGGR